MCSLKDRIILLIIMKTWEELLIGTYRVVFPDYLTQEVHASLFKLIQRIYYLLEGARVWRRLGSGSELNSASVSHGGLSQINYSTSATTSGRSCLLRLCIDTLDVRCCIPASTLGCHLIIIRFEITIIDASIWLRVKIMPLGMRDYLFLR
jgi:hypothetical protein